VHTLIIGELDYYTSQEQLYTSMALIEFRKKEDQIA
jgi:hypothetical protein